MPDHVISDDLIEALRSGDEALDRGDRGPTPELALLHKAGLLIAPLSTDEGGRGLGTSAAGADTACAVLTALGGASLPIARLYEGHVNAAALIYRHATSGQRARLVAAVHRGALLGVWGADSERPVVLEAGGSSVTLSGVKAFASGLGDIAIAIVTARDPRGLQMVIVMADDAARADHTSWDVDGMVGSRSGRFDCTGLSADFTDQLGGLDALFTEPDFHGGVWRLAACYAGAMQRLAVLSADWLAKRAQLDAPLMTARLGAIVVEADTAKLWSRHAARLVEGNCGDPGAAIATALFAREAVEQAAIRQLSVAERLFGTAMHRRSSEAGRIARDLRFYLRQADLDGKLALATSHWQRT